MGIRLIFSKIYFHILIAFFFYFAFYFVLTTEDFFLNSPYNLFSLFINIFVATFVSFIFIPLLEYIQRSSDIIFYRGSNPRTIIKNLSLKFNSVIDLEHLISVVNREFLRILATEEVRMIFTRERADKIDKFGNVKFCLVDQGKMRDIEIPAHENLIYRYMMEVGITLVRDEVKGEKGETSLVRAMDRENMKVVTPLRVRQGIIGAIILGEKMNQDAYTKEDIEFLEIISAQVAVAIENARLYTEVSDFNRQLQKRIKEATADLQTANLNLKLANEKLRQLDQAKSEFLSIASHQLRTPLTSIKGFISLIMEGIYGKVPPKIRGTVEKIYVSNERLIGLVEDLLNISRIESGRMTFDFAKDSLLEMLCQVVDALKLNAKAKDLTLSFEKPAQPLSDLFFDKRKIQEVVSNLIDNAIKYTSKGKVQVQTKETGDVIRIIVSDSGKGIAKGEINSIFEKFRRGAGSKELHTEGVGLGLYVCKKIVEAHEGKIWAESEGKGKGSQFIIELKKDFIPPPPKKIKEDERRE